MSSTASDWSSMTIETLARSTQSENPISTTSSLSSEVVNGGRDQETLSCAFCPAKFAGIYARGNYGRHRRQKHVDHNREFQCEVSHCPKVFRRHDARLKHYRRQHPDLVHNSESGNDWHARRRRASCTDETRGEQQDYLSPKNRLQSTGGDSEMIYMDTTPSTPTMVVNELSTEVIRQEGENIRCDICQKEFNRAAELRRHKDSVHNLNSLQYFCEVPGCDRASRPFPRKDKLADHTARVHTQALALRALGHGEEALQPTYHCGYQGCERTFDQRADLLRHQRTHTDKSERPHKCAQCEQSFLYPKDLRRHQATHLDNEDDDKPSFHCEVASCEYGPGRQGFSRRDGMIRHMRRSHPELIADEET
ncbi:hypothetical protein IG631_05632 [Alternaria alternata]|nr:hypothetical protein IG631_05632 [Alternaria alternata]